MDNSSTKPLAVVTGASSGIGYELAKQFAQNGFDLVVAAEDQRIADAAQAFSGLGAQVDSVQVDLATPDGVEELSRRIKATGRPVAAAAINAGVGVAGDFARQTDLDAELNLVDLNVRSTVHLAKRVVPDMVARGEGRVLFTASEIATSPAPYQAVYGASKAFVYSFAEGLRGELKDSGVTVTALMPSATETEFFERAGAEDTKVGQAKKDDPEQVARQGYEGLMAGEAKVVAGSLKSRIATRVSDLLPDAASAAAHGKVSEPGSGS